MNDATRDGGPARGQAAKPRLRLAMIIGGQPGQASECRVDDPDRVLRAWSMLNASDQELQSGQPAAGDGVAPRAPTASARR